MTAIIAIFIAGGLGALSRYIIAQYINISLMTQHILGFSIGIIGVNIIGCILAGLAYEYMQAKNLLSSHVALWVMSGFLGGFTTFSAFMVENIQLWHHGQYGAMGLYITLTLMGSFLGFIVAQYMAKLWL